MCIEAEALKRANESTISHLSILFDTFKSEVSSLVTVNRCVTSNSKPIPTG